MTSITSLERSSFDNCEESMTIDDATYLILRSATGAFTCRSPPVPKSWNPVDRPHIALLIPDDRGIFTVFLSHPGETRTGQTRLLEMVDLTGLPTKSIIEVRHNTSHYTYYRRDNGSWTKVAEASDPFGVEVFSHGYAPVSLSNVPMV